MAMYTMEDWHRDKVLKLEVGQEVHDNVVWQLRDCVPPVSLSRSFFQVGEAKDSDDDMVALYDTFERDVESGGHWIYLGTCRAGERTPREGYYDKYYKKNS